MERRRLYNQLQELRGNIRVFCRVRKDEGECQFEFPNENEVIVNTLQGGKDTLEFDKCYGPDSQQEKVFEDTKPTILSCIDGYNVCIMAYGQTGSGKTFTMMGPVDNPGVNRRAIKELFEMCKSRNEVRYTISVSIMEVYNEKLFDLLQASREDQNLSIHSGPQGTYVSNLTEHTVASQEEIEEIMAQGDKNRSTSSTKMNSDSSRSHLLLQLKVTGHNSITGASTSGKLTLVDLAGSERISKTDASGDRLVEAAAINKSLTSLGQVFQALASGAPHVPYRNSKLTYALQDSLGGDSKTCVFVNCSPKERCAEWVWGKGGWWWWWCVGWWGVWPVLTDGGGGSYAVYCAFDVHSDSHFLNDACSLPSFSFPPSSNLSETHCTLKFGQNVRKVELGPASKNKKGGGGGGRSLPAPPRAARR